GHDRRGTAVGRCCRRRPTGPAGPAPLLGRDRSWIACRCGRPLREHEVTALCPAAPVPVRCSRCPGGRPAGDRPGWSPPHRVLRDPSAGAPAGDRARAPVRVPLVHPARRPGGPGPHRALGGGRPDLRLQPGSAVPTAPSRQDPRGLVLRDGHTGHLPLALSGWCHLAGGLARDVPCTGPWAGVRPRTADDASPATTVLAALPRTLPGEPCGGLGVSRPWFSAAEDRWQ